MIAWERSRAASSYGIIWGTQVEANMAEFSAESRGVDCSGDRKVLTELQIAIYKIKVIVLDDQKSRELRRIRMTCSAVYLYDVVNKYA